MKAIFTIGSSGAGKSTLVSALAQKYLTFFGEQDSVSVNLDCANPHFEGDIDIC